MFEMAQGEALNSFYSRNLFFAGKTVTKNKKDFYLFERDVWTVEKLIGWIGKMGVDRVCSITRLVFESTTYHRHSFVFFEDPMDTCCLGRKKSGSEIRNHVGANTVKFCPACVINDIEGHGFVYWKRNHQDNVKVCWRHNLILQDTCGFCERSFGIHSNYFEGAWGNCVCGAGIFDIKTEVNCDFSELKVAVFLAEFYDYNYRVSYFHMNKMLSKRLDCLLIVTTRDLYDYLAGTVSKCCFKSILELKGTESPSDFLIKNISLLAFMFSSFSEFIFALVEEKVDRHNVFYQNPTIEEVAERLRYSGRLRYRKFI